MEQQREPVAVIGFSARFPGAGSYPQFWDNLAAGKSFVTDIPADRWDWKEYGRMDGKIKNRTVVHQGCFLDNISSFDYRFFSISKREADNMDPQQRMLLEESWACLEDAGVCPSSLAGRKVGVFVAGYNTDFRDLLERNQEIIAPHHLSGGGSFSLANRLSFFYDLRGASVTLDTACSGALAAIKYAADAVLSGECEMALAGACNVMLAPDNYVRLTAMHMISPTGKVRTFDRDADGYVRGEGAGVFLLKPLSRALSDGDRVHAVILGTAVNHCGRTPSYTYPSAEEQACVIRDAVRNAGVSVDRIRYIELHGTGTPKGDPIEFEGLAGAFAALAEEQQVPAKKLGCALGSVKTNIGHLENAAGLAGLAKVILSMQHGEIPATLNFEHLNPLIHPEGTPFRLVTEKEVWKAEELRTAGVSSWGLGGTNVHVILQEYREPEAAPAEESIPQLYILSANTREGLCRRAESLLARLQEQPVSGADLSLTLLRGRDPLKYRAAFTADSPEGVREALRALAEETEAPADAPETAEIPVPSMVPDSDDRKSEAYRQWLEALGRAFTAGADIREAEIPYGNARRIHLPAYDFEKTECWIPERGPVNGVLPLEEAAEAGAPEEGSRVICYRETWEPAAFSSDTAAEGPAAVLTPAGFAGLTGDPEVYVLEVAEDYRAVSEKHIRVRPDRQEDLANALRAFRKACPELNRIADLLPLSERFRRDLFQPAVLLRACAELQIRNLRILSAVDYDGAEEKALADSRIGYERTLRVVMRDARMRCMLVRRGSLPQEELVRLALRECRSGEERSILYEGGERKQCVIREINLPESGTGVYRENGVYLLTGGCGGLGKMLAGYLLKAVNARLVLTGRSPEAARQQELDGLRALGGKVLYLQADAGKEDDLRAAVLLARNTWGRLDGVFCAAGIEDEESILTRGKKAFDATLSVKIDGALAMDRALAAEGIRPDFITYYSSSSAVLGDFGSCDYAIANRFLKAYAAEGGGTARKVAVCWPLWKDGGMSLRDGDTERLYLASSGQEYMTEPVGMQALERVLAGGVNDVLVMAGNRERIGKMLGAEGQTGASPVPERPQAQAAACSPADGTVQADAEADDLPVEQKVLRELKKLSGEILCMDPKEWMGDTNFADIGFESVTLGNLSDAISERFGIDLGTDVFFGYPTFLRMSRYLTEKYPEAMSRAGQAKAEAAEEIPAGAAEAAEAAEEGKTGGEEPEEGIAVIGMSGQFPDAANVEELWEILAGGKEVIAAVPESRFMTAGSADPACRMGMISDPEQFDPLFFDIAPGEAEEMDPRQRLLLEESWKALEDAGLGTAELDGAPIGVFVGAEDGDWRVSQGNRIRLTSAHNGIMASRLAYFLNFSGPCLSINTACSSGLTAFHQACLSIRNGDCETAIVAGVNLTLDRENYDSMARVGMLSRDGRCRTFDQGASGMVPSDAVAVVVLKKLSAARRDRHRIYATVAGTGINYDGKTSGITAPSLAAQEHLYRRIYGKSGTDPKNLSWILTHGTGTRIGDPIEISGLKNAFQDSGMREGRCALTSIKPNIGHALAASGIVGLIALLLGLREETIPGMISIRKINERIRLDHTPFCFNLENKPWTERDYGPRTGAVSAFGMSGTNAHAVLRSAPAVRFGLACPAYLMVFSAKTESALARKLQEMASFLRRKEDTDLTSVSYTLLEGRVHFRCRFAAVVRNREELITALEQADAGSFSTVGHEFYEKTAEQRRIGQLLAEAGQNPEPEALRQLAVLYRTGYRIDGNLLLGSREPVRISLPAYPFENRCCWPGERASGALLYPVWETVEKQAALPDGPAVVFCGDAQQAEVLSASFRQATVVSDFSELGLSGQLAAAGDFCQAVWAEPDGPAEDPAGTEAILAAFRTVKALLQASGERPLTLTVLTRAGQAVTGKERANPSAAGIAGFFGVVSQEIPAWRIRVLDLEAEGFAPDAMKQLLKNLPDVENGETAALRGGCWTVRRMKPRTAGTGKGAALRRNGVYVVPGGAGDVGTLWTEYAVRTAGARVVWAGRRAETEEIRARMDRIAEFGPRPEYLQADVTDRASLERLHDRVKDKYGTINGVILSTVAEFDRGIRTMDEDEYRRIVALKAAGCINAESVFGPDEPDFLLNFSSSSAIDRPLGQAGYTTGCCFADAYAHRISGEGRHAYRTVNWGFWGGVGAGKAMPESIRSRIERTGMRPLEPEKAFLDLDRLLKSGEVQAEIINRVETAGAAHEAAAAETVRACDAPAAPAAAVRASAVPAAGTPRGTDPCAELVEETLCGVLKLGREELDIRERFERYGVDSITVLQLIEAFRSRIPALESTVFYECRTPKELIDYIRANHAAELLSGATETAGGTPEGESGTQAEIPAAASGNEPIAVIGMSGRFAGAGNPDEYWQILRDGIDSVREVPADRWSLDGFYEPDMEKAVREKKSYCKDGGFLEDITSFDGRFFHISPREAACLDPQERLLLEESYKALENAAWPPSRIQAEGREDTGVFVGVTRTGFELYNQQLWDSGDNRILTTNFSEMANRISYCFDLRGPSMAIDTMCSSSLTALHEACEHLRHGACRMAVVGTANIYTHPATYRLFCEKRMLSPTGRCHTFSRNADGFVPGESVSALVLKPLSAARADGDRIYGVIRATGVNHDGRTNGFTVPSPAAQAVMIRDTLDRGGISAREISYVEAHGTGTKLGDPIEINGLTKAFRADTADKGYCAIGSAKSNIGHCEAAAGLAGVIKVLLQMQHRMLAPSLHAEELNPLIFFSESPFRVQTKLEAWERPVVEKNGKRTEIPRRAAVSAFGAGGSNAHVILEESPDNP